MKNAKNRHPNARAHDQLIKKGMGLYEQGDLPQAEYCFQLVLREHPHHPEALNQLGVLVLAADAFTMSVEFLEKAVKAAPKIPTYRNNLANSYILSGQYKKALPHLRKALAGDPRLLAALMNLGVVYRFMEDGREAAKTYRKAVLFHGDNLGAQMALADTLLDLGENDEAFEIFHNIFKSHPQNIEAIRGIANARTHKTDKDNFLASFESLIDDPLCDENTRLYLHIAAGKIANDLKLWDRAFCHYAKGNQLSPNDFSMANMRTIRAGQKQLFTARFFATRQNFGTLDERPVFVVGMPRSGTTLVEQILDSHPQIKGAGEMPDLDLVLADYSQYQPARPEAYGEKFSRLTDQQTRQLAQNYLKALERHSRTALRVVDKLPHNFEFLGYIALLFPNAHIVHCKRDPMDNCVSCFMSQFNSQHGYVTDLAMLGEYYRQYDDLMAHWKKVLPIKMIDIEYEKMVSDQEKTSRELVAFLDLEWRDECLDFHRTKRTVSTPSRNQVRQPIYTSSVRRWQRYDRHLTELKEALGDLFVP